jgi:hypothetical protein
MKIREVKIHKKQKIRFDKINFYLLVFYIKNL